MLDRITPVILTANEEANIGRSLERLQWARDVVVVDSESRDATAAIARSFPNVRFFVRPYDQLASQWNYAIRETEIATEWILALDADFLLTEEFIAELVTLTPAEEINAYECPFTYAIQGRPLRGSLYPPKIVLIRSGRGQFIQDGHSQVFVAEGAVLSLWSRIVHDDRKPLDRWLSRQKRYMEEEADKLLATDPRALSAADRLRRLRIFAPFAALVYTLILKRCILDGWPGMQYAFERFTAEAILSLELMDRHLRGK